MCSAMNLIKCKCQVIECEDKLNQLLSALWSTKVVLLIGLPKIFEWDVRCNVLKFEKKKYILKVFKGIGPGA